MRLILLFLPIALCAKVPLLAVSELTPRGVSKNDASIIADRFRSELLETGKVRVLERTEMAKILREQAFSRSGACDSGECAVEIGRLLAVDRMVVGSVGRIGGLYTLGVRLLDMGTGEILFSANKDQEGGMERLLVEDVPELAAKLSEGAVSTSSFQVRKPGFGDLQVALSDPEAKLFLDGKPVSGESPYFLEHLESGVHKLVAKSKNKYAEASVELAPDDLQKVVLTLVPGNGAIRLYSEPMGAMVFLDGQEIGETPLKKADVPAGLREIRLEREGFFDTTFRVDIDMDATATRKIRLAPCGVLELSSNTPIHPVLWRDLDTLRPSRTDRIQLRPGAWRLRPNPDRDWIARDTAIEIRVGEKLRLDLAFKRYYATLKVRAPDDAKVVLDGRHIGMAPLEYGFLEPGVHNLEIPLRDSTWRREFHAESGQVLPFFVGVERPSALLRIRSEKPGQVYLDDAYAGPLALDTSRFLFKRYEWRSDTLESGKHLLVVTSDGFQGLDTTIHLARGAMVDLEARWKRVSPPPLPASAMGTGSSAGPGSPIAVLSGLGAAVSAGAFVYWGTQPYEAGTRRGGEVLSRFLISGALTLVLGLVAIAAP